MFLEMKAIPVRQKQMRRKNKGGTKDYVEQH